MDSKAIFDPDKLEETKLFRIDFSMARKYHQGFFTPRNPQKYKGDPNKIVYRSSWEAACFKKLDEHPDVIQWASEEQAILYTNPFDGKPHRYFPDIIVWKREGKEIKVYMIEIKPHAQTQPPKEGKSKKRYLTEVQTWGINSAKWAAARRHCEKRGWTFQILSEKHLGLF